MLGKEPGDELIRVVEEREPQTYAKPSGMGLVQMVSPGYYAVTVDLPRGPARRFESSYSVEDAIMKARGYIGEQKRRKDGGSLVRPAERVRVGMVGRSG